MRGYHEYRGGYHEYRGDIMSTVGVILSTVGIHEYHGGKIFCYLSTPTVLMIPPHVS